MDERRVAAAHARRGSDGLLVAQPPGAVAQGRHQRRPPVRARGLLRLRRRHAAVPRRAGGRRGVPHRCPHVLLPRLRSASVGSTAREHPAEPRRVPSPRRRTHGRAGVDRGARRPRDAGGGVRQARRRRTGLPARVGRARRAVEPVLVRRPQPVGDDGAARRAADDRRRAAPLGSDRSGHAGGDRGAARRSTPARSSTICRRCTAA